MKNGLKAWWKFTSTTMVLKTKHIPQLQQGIDPPMKTGLRIENTNLGKVQGRFKFEGNWYSLAGVRTLLSYY